MAYANEETVRLAEIPKNEKGDYVVVSKITNKSNGNVSGDVRIFYTDAKDDNKVKPSPRGARFSGELALEIMTAMLDLLEYDELETLKETIEKKLDGDEELEEEAEKTKD